MLSRELLFDENGSQGAKLRAKLGQTWPFLNHTCATCAYVSDVGPGASWSKLCVGPCAVGDVSSRGRGQVDPVERLHRPDTANFGRIL